MCSAFSFEMTSGEIPFIQNNTSFSAMVIVTKSFFENQMNTLGINIQDENSNETCSKAKLKRLDNIGFKK